MAAAKSGGAAKKAAPTKDRSDDKHKLDNADAPVSGATGTTATRGDTGDNPSDAELEARAHSDAQRADATPKPKVEAELSEGVDPITGGEKSVTEAVVDRVPVMVPESKGDIRTDVTWPTHVQAPPAAQVAGEMSKANSSTRQREAAARNG